MAVWSAMDRPYSLDQSAQQQNTLPPLLHNSPQHTLNSVESETMKESISTGQVRVGKDCAKDAVGWFVGKPFHTTLQLIYDWGRDSFLAGPGLGVGDLRQNAS